MMNKLEEIKQPIMKTLDAESIKKIEEVKKVKELSTKDIKQMEKEHPMPKAEPKLTKEEIRNAEYDAIKKEEKTAYDQLKNNEYWADAVIDEAYLKPINSIKLVLMKKGTGFVWKGAGGWGKSATTFAMLKKHKDENPDYDYAYTQGKITPQAFYMWLYENKDKDCILDDPSKFFDDETILDITKGALWANDGKNRLVCYKTPRIMKDKKGKSVPGNFIMTGGLIILTNTTPKKNNADVQATLSRMEFYDSDLSDDEKRAMLKKVASVDRPDLNAKERNIVLSYLLDKIEDGLKDVTLRTLVKMFGYYDYSKQIGDMEMWKKMSADEIDRKFVEKDSFKLLVEKVEKDKEYATREEKARHIMQVSGASRATYFRKLIDYGITKSYSETDFELAEDKVAKSQSLKTPKIEIKKEEPKKDLVKEKINS